MLIDAPVRPDYAPVVGDRCAIAQGAAKELRGVEVEVVEVQTFAVVRFNDGTLRRVASTGLDLVSRAVAS